MDIDTQSAKNAFDLLDYRKEGVLDIEEILENMTKLGYDRTHPELFIAPKTTSAR